MPSVVALPVAPSPTAPPRGVAAASHGAGIVLFLLGLAALLLATPRTAAAEPHATLPLAAAQVTMTAAAPASAKADDSVPEYALKAAVLYNFARYTEWPSATFEDRGEEKDPFVFGILGSDPFGKYIDDLLKDKELGGRKVVLRRFASLDELQRCQVLFVSRSVEKQLKDVLKVVKPWNTFTVAEFGDFARDGGIARIFLQSLQVRFEINTDAAERARLKISSQLLKLAVVLRDD